MKSALLCLFLEPQTSLVTRLCFVLRLSQKYLQNRHYQEKNKRGEDPKFPRKISLSYTFSSFVNPLFSIPKVSSPQTMKVPSEIQERQKRAHQAGQNPSLTQFFLFLLPVSFCLSVVLLSYFSTRKNLLDFLGDVTKDLQRNHLGLPLKYE